MRYVIFDMDGVIVDTEPLYRENSVNFFKSLGIDIPKEVYDLNAGSNLPRSYYTFKEHVPEFNMSYEEYISERGRFASSNRPDVTKVVDKDIYPLLDWLKEKKIRIALASSSPRQNIMAYLDALGIRGDFELIVSGDQFTKTKPDPEIYIFTMGELGADPSDCLVIEDSTYGIAAGKAAGAYVAAKRDDRFGYDQSPADRIIDSLLEVEDIIECNNKEENV